MNNQYYSNILLLTQLWEKWTHIWDKQAAVKSFMLTYQTATQTYDLCLPGQGSLEIPYDRLTLQWKQTIIDLWDISFIPKTLKSGSNTEGSSSSREFAIHKTKRQLPGDYPGAKARNWLMHNFWNAYGRKHGGSSNGKNMYSCIQYFESTAFLHQGVSNCDFRKYKWEESIIWHGADAVKTNGLYFGCLKN